MISWSVSGPGSASDPCLKVCLTQITTLKAAEGLFSHYLGIKDGRCVSMYTATRTEQVKNTWLSLLHISAIKVKNHSLLQRMSRKETKQPASTNASREMIIQKMARDYNAMKAAKNALEEQNNELLGIVGA